MKIFLLEADQLVKEQVSKHITQNYEVELKLFEDSKQLIRASVSHYPDMIIFGIDENSKNLFKKLFSFRKSFNTKLIVIVSTRDTKEVYPLEIAHHILYKPFTSEDLDHCLVNYLGAKEMSTTEEIQQEEIQQLDILESNSFDFDVKKNFVCSDTVSMDEVRQELYDDVMVLDYELESSVLPDTIANAREYNKLSHQSFNPEVHVRGKRTELVSNNSNSVLKNYFQKVQNKINKYMSTGDSRLVIPSSAKQEQKTSKLDLSSLKQHQNSSSSEEFSDNVLSVSDFNLKFLD